MYTISKGPSQIVAKTRRGLAQKLESMDSIRDMTRKNSDSDEIESSANPVRSEELSRNSDLTFGFGMCPVARLDRCSRQ